MLTIRVTDAELELSDEEVLGYSSSNSDDDEEDTAPTKPSRIETYSEDEQSQQEEEEEEGWGNSRKDYYNADVIETEIDAREEEEEARRLQQRKLQKMSEADFGFDENQWLGTAQDEDDEENVITEVLKDVEITPEMSTEERLRILQTRYPEFEFLANEFLQLQPVLGQLQAQVNVGGARKEVVAKCRAVAAYVAALSMYFALLTSPSRNSTRDKTLDPAELRDHPIMDCLLQCRSLWMKVKGLKASTPAPIEATVSGDESMVDIEEVTQKIGLENGTSRKEKKSAETHTFSSSASARSRAARLQAVEASLADLSSLIPSKSHNLKSTKIPPSKPTLTTYDSDNSDFGEAETLNAKAASDKAARKKSLRFYTSQITQKSNKRAGAGRDAGGDEDLPYRERFRDRQLRLNAEAEARGKKLDSYGRGAALGEDDSGDEGQGKVAEELRGEEDDYYDLVAQTSKNKQRAQEEKAALIKQAKKEGGLLRVVEEGVDGDGKRAIGYVIQKNAGLAPKRKKEVRNPRVKKRMKFEEKKRKLASTRAVYKGGEERGGYAGEKTGIKTGLVKSVKL